MTKVTLKFKWGALLWSLLVCSIGVYYYGWSVLLLLLAMGLRYAPNK